MKAKNKSGNKGQTMPIPPRSQWSESAKAGMNLMKHLPDMKFKPKTRAEQIAMLKEIARQGKMTGETRKAFLAQGINGIDMREAQEILKTKVKAMMAEIEPVLKKHGALSSFVIANLDLPAAVTKIGQKGWVCALHVRPADGLEHVGMLSGALQAAIAKGVSTTQF